MALTLTQRQALAIVPKFTGALSIIGSAFIISDVLTHAQKRKQTYSRLLLGMSCFDFVTSCMYFLSTWPIPAGSGPIYASGTQGSCTFQGFFIQLSLAAPLYNFCLAFYYLLVIKYNWAPARLRKIEVYFHPIIIAISVGLAIAGLPLTIYNNANVWCWIAPGPDGSGRGENAWVYRWAFYYVELWLVIVAVTAIMSVIICSVYEVQRASNRYVFGAKKGRTGNSMSKNVRTQAFCYVLAFYLTWAFPTTLRILQTIGIKVPYAIFLCAVIFTPCQGFFNCLIYLRPRFARYRQRNPGQSLLQATRSTAVQSLPKAIRRRSSLLTTTTPLFRGTSAFGEMERGQDEEEDGAAKMAELNNESEEAEQGDGQEVGVEMAKKNSSDSNSLRGGKEVDSAILGDAEEQV